MINIIPTRFDTLESVIRWHIIEVLKDSYDYEECAKRLNIKIDKLMLFIEKYNIEEIPYSEDSNSELYRAFLNH